MVLTPSLNKSFKFQSDWPYNNSQIYLLDKVLDDINKDSEYKFKKTDKGYEIITKVNYPNNKNLVKEKIVLDDKYNIKKIYVYDSDDLICMKMAFNNIDYSPKFSNDYFEIDEVMSTFEIEEVNDWVILRKYHGNDEKLVIPEGVTDIDFGAFAKSFCSINFVLIAACGQADAQIPHCKQFSEFQ